MHPQRKPWGSMTAAVADALTVVADRPRVLAGVPAANQVGGRPGPGGMSRVLVVSSYQASGVLLELPSANWVGPRLGARPG